MALTFASTPGLMTLGPVKITTNFATDLALNTTFTFGSSGTAACIGFFAAESQSSANLTIYAYSTTTVTGSPNGQILLYNNSGSTWNLAGTSVASSATTAVTGAGWFAFTFTGVTLTKGAHYWAIITNATSSTTWTVRRKSAYGAGAVNHDIFLGQSTTDGFQTATSVQTDTYAPIVVKYGSGTLQGCPWSTTSTKASDQHATGVRARFNEQMTIYGITFCENLLHAASIKIYDQSGVEQATGSFNFFSNNVLAGGNHFSACFFDTPFTVTKNVDYDIVVLNDGTNTTVPSFMSMGTSPPADVKACGTVVNGTQWLYLDGTTPWTPGSATTNDGKYPAFALILSDNPAANVTGGGQHILRASVAV